MLDVHPPEHAPHSVRDFFLHIFTITIGLLIALGLESFVEWRHHVHLGHEAAANLRREIESNRNELNDVVQAVPGEQNDLRGMLTFLDEQEAGKPITLHRVHSGMKLATLPDASWQTASATGALAYVPYEEVQRFAAAYELQKQYTALQSASLQPAIGLFAAIGTTDIKSISAEDARRAKPEARALMANIEGLRQLGASLESAYAEALKQ